MARQADPGRHRCLLCAAFQTSHTRGTAVRPKPQNYLLVLQASGTMVESAVRVLQRGDSLPRPPVTPVHRRLSRQEDSRMSLSSVRSLPNRTSLGCIYIYSHVPVSREGQTDPTTFCDYKANLEKARPVRLSSVTTMQTWLYNFVSADCRRSGA